MNKFDYLYEEDIDPPEQSKDFVLVDGTTQQTFNTTVDLNPLFNVPYFVPKHLRFLARGKLASFFIF